MTGVQTCALPIYHGLKEEVHDDFIAVGKAVKGRSNHPNVFSYEANGDLFLSTAVIAPHDMTGYALTGSLKPVKVWLDGEVVTGATLKLKAGANPLALQYTKPGRTYFVVSQTPDAPPKPDIALTTNGQPKFKPSDLAMSWWTNENVLAFDVRSAEKVPVGWYRFQSPPGLRAFAVNASGKVQAWAAGVPLAGDKKFVLPKLSAGCVTVFLRIEQERGCYGGAALPEPIQLDCGPGQFALGDWSLNDSLACFSGGAWYRKTVTIPKAENVTLDLGDLVASAEVRVNGQPAGVRVAPPWTFDITKLVLPGENRIEVLVCNTLANQYLTVPTQYRGSTVAGLLGPVQLRVEAKAP